MCEFNLSNNHNIILTYRWLYKEHRKEAKARKLLAELETRKPDVVDSNGNVTIIENEHVTNSNSNNISNNSNYKSKDNLVEDSTDDSGFDNQAFEK
jgi:hypothetical protein